MKVSFHGAAQGVTGSCHLVETAGKRILIDCGMFQGSRELDEENSVPFGFDARAIDYVLLTHAHLDHCGRLPLLAKRGFAGEIITTEASAELAELVMLDAAHLQEEDVQFRARQAGKHGHGHDHGGHGHPAQPQKPAAPALYTVDDANACLKLFGRKAVYGQAIDVCPGVTATFHNAGHILGSASILVEGDDKRAVFSGDLGSGTHQFLLPPDPPASADLVVMESTYGDRQHATFADSKKELYDAINAAHARGGNVVIPSFALERAQEILFFLRQGADAGLLPPDILVYLDSPMAISATQIFEKHKDDFAAPVKALFDKGEDPFGLPNLHFTRDKAASIAINSVKKGAIIMAGSGMASGGRVRHHLIQNLPRAESTVIFVGYSANGTLGRQLMDGAKQVNILGDHVTVRAQVKNIGGFSAHADQDELVAWQAHIAGKAQTALVHGETGSMQALSAKLAGKVLMPRLNDEIAV